ncbi:MAG TPA: response regulator transcription factor [Armatimonadota bacterium]|jgi:DNA-binding NarL/FixJ family response regulator
MSLRIVIADDHTLMRAGLRSLLERDLHHTVVGEASNGRDALEQVNACTPELVIMDIGMPELNGIEASRHIMETHPLTKIIALSIHADVDYVVEMLKAGAKGYLLKDSALEELQLAIQCVFNGQTYLAQRLATQVFDDYLRRVTPQQQHTAYDVLTPRDREIVQLLAEGHTSKEIADRLSLAVSSVETYRSHIMAKLNLRSIASLTKYAIREGITSIDAE